MEQPFEAAHAVQRTLRTTVVRRPKTKAVFVVAPSAPKRDRAVLPVVDQPEIVERHKVLASEVLGLLPKQCQAQLKHFYVRYDKPERRGLAGNNVIIIDGTMPDDEFRAVLIHEALGHLFDVGCLMGNEDAGASAFLDGSLPIYNDDPSLAFYRISWTSSQKKRPNTNAQDFVSGYAETDPFEDLAESATYFLLHRRAFRERARKNVALATKYKWLEAFLPAASSVEANDTTAWKGIVPWDITKLPYAWRSATLAKK